MPFNVSPNRLTSLEKDRFDVQWVDFVMQVCGLCLLSLGVFAESVRQDYAAISTFSALPSSIVIFLAVGVMAVGIVGLVGFKTENVQVMRIVSYYCFSEWGTNQQGQTQIKSQIIAKTVSFFYCERWSISGSINEISSHNKVSHRFKFNDLERAYV